MELGCTKLLLEFGFLLNWCERDIKSHYYMTHWILQELHVSKIFGVKYKMMHLMDYKFVNFNMIYARRRRKINAPISVNVYIVDEVLYLICTWLYYF